MSVNKLLFIIFLPFFIGYSQNYFPLISLKSYSYFDSFFQWGPYGGFWEDRDFVSVRTIDTLNVDSIKFTKFYFNRNLGPYYLHYNDITKKLYRYFPNTDSIKLAFDFTIPIDSSFVSNFYDTITTLCKKTSEDSILLFNKYRKRVAFYLMSPQYPIYFVEDVGLYAFTFDRFGAYSYSEFKFFQSLHDSFSLNPTIVRIDSTNIKPKRLIEAFPFSFQVFANISDTYSFEQFYVIARVFRDTVCIIRRQYAISTQTLRCFFNIKEDELLPGDIITTKVVYKDSSIFNNYIQYPADSFYTTLVLPKISSTEEELSVNKNEELYEPYPNPSNSMMKLGYYSPVPQKVSISLFDILGKEVQKILNNELVEGLYSYSFSTNSLSTGVYFIRSVSGNKIQTKKIIVLK